MIECISCGHQDDPSIPWKGCESCLRPVCVACEPDGTRAADGTLTCPDCSTDRIRVLVSALAAFPEVYAVHLSGPSAYEEVVGAGGTERTTIYLPADEEPYAIEVVELGRSPTLTCQRSRPATSEEVERANQHPDRRRIAARAYDTATVSR